MNYIGRITTSWLSLLLLTFLFVTGANAVPPSPEAKKKWVDQGIWNQKVDNWKSFKEAGGCAPSEYRVIDPSKLKANRATGAQAVDTINVILILVDFVDHPWNGQTVGVTHAMFDSILFSDRNTDAVHMPYGSMHDFYLENSYGQFFIKGDIYGWFRAPQTYAYYEGGNDGLGPRVRQLVRDCVLKADSAGADFSDYDHDGNGQCDGVLVVHAGAGAETGAFGIWSHNWTISPTLNLDGVNISTYNINPEEAGGGGPSSIGVFCHEYGHFLGLPDLYDIDYEPASSDGTGDWSLMSGGSWNGGGARPSHFDAWSKSDLGFVDVIDVTTNLKQAPLPAVEYNPVVYRLSNSNSLPNEFWYVENRQKTGFDIALPSEGIMIYHVDYAVAGSNNDPNRYFVAVEQADGEFDLEWTNGNAGDGGDPWPGNSNARIFNDLTVPSPSTNVSGAQTNIGVWEISDNDSVMYADLDISWSRPMLKLSGADSIEFDDPFPLGDGDGDLDPGDTANFVCKIENLMLTGYNPHVNLSTSNPSVIFLENDVPMNGNLTDAPVSNSFNPVKIFIDDSVDTKIETFTLTITSDSLPSTPGSGEYVAQFTFTYAVGTPKILMVDDDRGASYDSAITRVFQSISEPYKVWNKQTSGSPTGGDLSNYPMVFWNTGPSAANVLNTSDIAAMKNFLDNGGSLFLSTVSGIQTLHNLDSTFLHNYFKARYVGTTTAQSIYGVDGTLLGEDSKYKAPPNAPYDSPKQTMAAVSGGEAFLSYTFGGSTPTAGISYSGAYNTVLISFALESVWDQAGGTFWPKDTLVERILFYQFDSPDSTNPRTVSAITTPGQSQNNVVNHTPTLKWSAILGYPNDFQSKYQLQVGTDNEWSVAEMWDTGEQASADSSTTYAGAALQDGVTYYARVRVENGFTWSDWFVATFRMNTPPQAPTTLWPIGGALSINKPKLFILNPEDAENDSPFIVTFEVFSDSNLTTLVAADSFVNGIGDSTKWTVDITLAYDTQFWWRARAYDGFEFSSFSNAETFVVQNAPQAPSAPIAYMPVDTGGWPLFQMLPTFDWSDAVDANPFDTLTYRLKIGLDSLFLSVININNLNLSQHTMTDSLLFNKRYWWRVTALDNTGLESPVSNILSFWTWTLGDINHSHSADIIDLNFMINRLFRTGPAPNPTFVGDVNGDCNFNILDLNYTINRIFRFGAPFKIGCEN